jgi:L-fuculose-phosphate aldolase
LLHEAALKARPDCNAAAHIHAPYLTAYAYCGKDIKLKCSTTFSLVFEEIPCLPYGLPGTIHIADGIEDAIKDHDLILLVSLLEKLWKMLLRLLKLQKKF